MDRVARLLSGLSVAMQKGLEIGPLNKPLIRKSMGDVLYIDHATTSELREKYAGHDFDVSGIVDVDLVWPKGRLTEVIAPGSLDYCVASHVVEHVPDLVGWLDQIGEALKPGGRLQLAIPDKRFCFDYARPVTTLGDVMDAHFARRTSPSYRHIFDYYSMVVKLKEADAWAGLVHADGLERHHSEEEALEKCLLARDTGAYVDVHCWVFTPDRFLEILAWLARFELIPFKLVGFDNTPVNDIEFFAFLEKVDPAIDRETRRELQVASFEAALRNCEDRAPWLTDLRYWQKAAQEDKRCGAALEEARREQERLQQALAAANTAVAAMQASTSWRITKPVRLVRLALDRVLGTARRAG